ncbi:MAG: hypothetical protein NT062_12755 [Proteobacteria bacterium]|nr:hypothetical protein [Pseudomonadota bacterium]
MNKLLSLALALPLVACVVGTDEMTPGPGPGSAPVGSDPPPSGTDPDPTALQGSITAPLTLSGAVKVTGAITIEAGAVVTVMPGTTIEIASPSVAINVKGTFDIQGAKGSEVVMQPTNAADHWGGVNVTGSYKMSYGKQIGGPIHMSGATASTLIVDSTMARASGDYLVMGGGTLDVQYSNLGLETGDSSHCNLHLNQAASIVFTHNNIAGAPYGLMFYAGAGDFTHNNWITVTGQYAVEPGNTGSANFADSYFSGGQPTATPGLNYNPLASAKLLDVGPR